jgi:molybdopterin-guanine dinucleotide biosynthesis protein A
MTAIILAGGSSSRMKVDKALLPVSGTSLIEAVALNISPYFKEIIISARSEEEYRFLPYKTVADKEPGQGPFMGILCGLEASSNDINFVIACDIPEINTAFLEELIQHAKHYEIVVPVTPDNKYEPLFAFYNKSLVPRITTLLSKKIRQIFQLYPMATLKKVPLKDTGWLYNLNTTSDYQNYLKTQEALIKPIRDGRPLDPHKTFN